MLKFCHNLHHLNRMSIKYSEKVEVGTLNLCDLKSEIYMSKFWVLKNINLGK